jgi:hypothetical protein
MTTKNKKERLSFTVRLEGEHRKRFLRYKEKAGLISNAEVIRHLLKKLENLEKPMENKGNPR